MRANATDLTRVSTVYAGQLDDRGPFRVVAETRAGERFVHPFLFPDDGNDTASGGRARSTRFAARVQASGLIDPSCWYAMPPVYGSDASAAEEAEASLYAMALSRGAIQEADIPDGLRVLL